MSYVRAEEVLPKELLETIQQYVNGRLIYIPCTEKMVWGSRTGTKEFLQQRNQSIYDLYRGGVAIPELVEEFALSAKSIQRIIRKMKVADLGCEIRA